MTCLHFISHFYLNIFNENPLQLTKHYKHSFHAFPPHAKFYICSSLQLYVVMSPNMSCHWLSPSYFLIIVCVFIPLCFFVWFEVLFFCFEVFGVWCRKVQKNPLAPMCCPGWWPVGRRSPLFSLSWPSGTGGASLTASLIVSIVWIGAALLAVNRLHALDLHDSSNYYIYRLQKTSLIFSISPVVIYNLLFFISV